jgi:hypothetical protein
MTVLAPAEQRESALKWTLSQRLRDLVPEHRARECLLHHAGNCQRWSDVCSLHKLLRVHPAANGVG